MDIKNLALSVESDVIKWRHYFHMYPELSFREKETTKKIVSILKDIGYQDISVGVPFFPETGVIATLNPEKKGKCIALRADIDALEISEEADVIYKSVNNGIMHACGHDAHISMLLGAAKALYNIRDSINGRVKFIFQPGEENYDTIPKTGARLWVEESDLLKDVDSVFGMHVWGGFPSGVFCYKPGPIMAMNAVAYLDIEGKGGHGAMPNTCIDPVVVACQIVSAWQTIISREIDPLDMAVITVGDIKTEGAWNIIPHNAYLTCGMRTLDEKIMKYIIKRMEEIAQGIGQGMRAKVKFKSSLGTPPVNNDENFTNDIVESIRKVFPPEDFKIIKPVMPSEDFSLYQQLGPTAFIFLGIGDEEKKTNYAQHHPKFKVDDSVLYKGVAAFTAASLDFINGK